METDPDEWISNLEGLQICMNGFDQKGNITDEDFVIHILNNLPGEYNVVLDGLESHLTTTRAMGLLLMLFAKN